LEVTEVAYPGYNDTDYQSVGKTMMSSTLVRETYEFVLQSPQETLRVQGNVVHNPNTDRIVSFNLQEVQ
jgi:rare lipoprotein A